MTAASLARTRPPPGESLYLRLVQQPLGGVELARWRLRPDRVRFSAPGRLARVGLFARLIDAGFTASLLLRGSVPGGTAAAAQIKYEAVRAADPRYVYHGRVVREHGWICLHYLFFYFMNDYRSTFYGVNDHEADWEQVFIYLEDAPDGPRPVWIAAAAHDYTGDELRRRWDDPTLEKDGDHVGHQRRRRLACLVLRARRVPHRGAHPGPPRARQLPRRRCASSGATRSASPTRATCAPRSRARSASRSSTTRAATA